MAIHIDAEPFPRAVGARPTPSLDLRDLVLLPGEIGTPASNFFDVLSGRSSGVGGRVPAELLGSLLWHATQLRSRRFDGRFGQWESRPSPSAGGIHPIRLLVLPLDDRDVAGVYDDASHSLGRIDRGPAEAIALNAASVAALTSAVAGTTLQLIADPSRIEACYGNHETLLWRDAGAATGTLCLVAEALGMSAVPLGRHGTALARAFGLTAPVRGLGAVHLGTRPVGGDPALSGSVGTHGPPRTMPASAQPEAAGKTYDSDSGADA